ncbi:nucleoside phosphorylase [Hyphococcus luteus]|uniref:Nucleoside phosphorylase n=1 Tax=Hyphococcus luteus TaxID=2058213 RepID=A0A2S7JZ29_9PROT|nr:nucleoside phosphorylase [Marinicaulis flavus]PQA85507.1 nucleoside phosphorylase [Marinicaulis flavus]
MKTMCASDTNSSNFIGVICGLKSEAQAVAAGVDKSKIRIGVSGANAARAEDIARDFCNEGASAIFSIGFSGGLDPALRPGDLVIGETIIADDGSVYAGDRYLLGCLNPALSRESGNPGRSAKMDPRLRGDERGKVEARLAALFGADEIVDSTLKKSALFQNHGAVAVDMESHGAARAAARAGAPFLAIRAIADPADRALPPAALNAVAPDGSVRALATVGAALRDPKQLWALRELGQDSAAAAKTLRRSLGPLFSRLFLSLDL